MRMLRLYSPDDLARCPLDKWGILDPGEYRRDQTEGEQLRRENGKYTRSSSLCVGINRGFMGRVLTLQLWIHLHRTST
jgi:hypothetical protein